MAKMNDPKIIANYLHCLSRLEKNTFILYHNLADTAEMPLVRTLLYTISQDSSKHSIVLKEIADSISVSEENPKDCAKKLGETWRVMDTCLRESIGKQGIGKPELSELMDKLTLLESSLAEEYEVFVQMKTLQYMVREINQLYSINLEETKGIFMRIIEDEEHHRDILATTKVLLSKAEQQTRNNTPKIRYQSPDAWVRSLPPNPP